MFQLIEQILILNKDNLSKPKMSFLNYVTYLDLCEKVIDP